MCGIAGIVGYDASCLSTALGKIQHRGPDHFGIYKVPGADCLLGHARLSIIDLDVRSNQPFLSDCGRYVLVFNGEIYNFQELRNKLERLGCSFHTSSDTEVLLHWLIKFGIDGLAELDGMFAFCFSDAETRSLVLARDPIGEKPLYYSFGAQDGDRRFAFASEIKALLDLPGLDKSLDQVGLADYLRFLYTAPPHTLYSGIKELPPGHFLKVNLMDVHDTVGMQYYSLDRSLAFNEDISFDEATEIFREAFTRSVSLRLISDVNVGIFLSAGIDSNAILSAAKKSRLSADMQSFTLRYRDGHDESKLARQAAEMKGLPNQAIEFSGLSFFDSLERVVSLFDQPFGNSTAIVSDMIAGEAAKSCKVCLAGDGGDELLVGYPRYKALHYYQQLDALPGWMKRAMWAGSFFLPERGRFAIGIRRAKQFVQGLNKPIEECVIDWSTYLDNNSLAVALGGKLTITEFYSSLIDTFDRHKSDPVRAATIVDMKSFVPFNLMQSADRTSMAHSLELRSPFLSTSLIHACLGMPSRVRLIKGKTKPLLTTPFAQDIPKFILNQPKKPFNPPLRVMLQKNLDVLEDYLLSPSARISSVMSKQFVAGQLKEFRAQSRDNSTFLWGLATLEHWLRRAA